jgi:hypothetical protein
MKRPFTIPLVCFLPALLFWTGCVGTDTPTGLSVEGEIDLAVAAAKKPAPSLSSTIDYVFVGHHGIFDSDGRRLVWDGEIHGDIEGQMLWWFVPGGGPPNMPDAAHVSFYEARWEIWDGDALLLAGNSAGTTARPPGKDGIWRGKGIVTEASAGFEDWNGRHVYEGGNVNWVFPYSGEGIFRIN